MPSKRPDGTPHPSTLARVRARMAKKAANRAVMLLKDETKVPLLEPEELILWARARLTVLATEAEDARDRARATAYLEESAWRELEGPPQGASTQVTVQVANVHPAAARLEAMTPEEREAELRRAGILPGGGEE